MEAFLPLFASRAILAAAAVMAAVGWLVGRERRRSDDLNVMDENRDCHQSIGTHACILLHGRFDVQGYTLVKPGGSTGSLHKVFFFSVGLFHGMGLIDFRMR